MDNNADFLRWALVVSCVGSGMMAGLFASFVLSTALLAYALSEI